MNPLVFAMTLLAELALMILALLNFVVVQFRPPTLGHVVLASCLILFAVITGGLLTKQAADGAQQAKFPLKFAWLIESVAYGGAVLVALVTLYAAIDVWSAYFH